jgi:pyruvate kinase
MLIQIRQRGLGEKPGGSDLRRAKIVCTIGPASGDRETLKNLVDAGMNVARINFSHGKREENGKIVELIREISRDVAIMQDLQGPKIRIGDIPGGELLLNDNEVLTLTTGESPGTDEKSVGVDYKDLTGDVSTGDNIYMADGIIHLQVEEVEGEMVRCRVVHGGVLTSRKGVNLPGVDVSTSALTENDREDLEYGIKLGFDYVALSFVKKADEIRELKWILKDRGAHSKVVAKIEKREALESIDEILDVTDAIMIARGDLGVEIPTEEVPLVQKSLIEKSLKKGRPVITATQMLESMVHSERPTRAEASDVANAVLDGTDAVMLSAETATGKYPVESVSLMGRIISEVENYGENRVAPYLSREALMNTSQCQDGGDEKEEKLPSAVCVGAVKISYQMEASAIACLTHTGRTARMMARLRPGVPVLALTDDPPVVRHMSLVWGVKAIPVERIETTDRIFAIVRDKLKQEGFRGNVVLTAGIPTKSRTRTNSVHVLHL